MQKVSPKTCCSTRCTLALFFKLYYALGIYKNSHQYLDTCNKRDDPPSPYLYKLWFRYKMFVYADSSSDNLKLMKSIGQTMNHEKCYKQRFILTFPIFPITQTYFFKYSRPLLYSHIIYNNKNKTRQSKAFFLYHHLIWRIDESVLTGTMQSSCGSVKFSFLIPPPHEKTRTTLTWLMLKISGTCSCLSYFCQMLM